jgi:hypothetical protein
MRTKTIVFILVAFALSTAFFACEEEKPPRTTGDLVVRVKLAGASTYLPNTAVGLALTQEQMDTASFHSFRVTDAEGVGRFIGLNPRKYYYYSGRNIDGVYYEKEGQVEILADVDINLTITLE